MCVEDGIVDESSSLAGRVSRPLKAGGLSPKRYPGKTRISGVSLPLRARAVNSGVLLTTMIFEFLPIWYVPHTDVGLRGGRRVNIDSPVDGVLQVQRA